MVIVYITNKDKFYCLGFRPKVGSLVLSFEILLSNGLKDNTNTVSYFYKYVLF